MISGSLPSVSSFFPVPGTTAVDRAANQREAATAGATITPGEATAVTASRNTESPSTQSASRPAASRTAGEGAGGLDEAELKELSQLKARDREVRAHEAAHQAAGGQHAGAVSFVYQRGPDGAQYAVGGEVSISLSPVQGDPAATIEKMRTVRAAAMAPAEPSAQDRAVAAEAMQLMMQAQAELARQGDAGASVSGRSTETADGDSEQSSRPANEQLQSYRSVSALADSPRNAEPASLNLMA